MDKVEVKLYKITSRFSPTVTSLKYLNQPSKHIASQHNPHVIQTEPLAGRHVDLSLTAHGKPLKLRHKHNRIGVFTDINEILSSK